MSYENMVERFPDFLIQAMQELKENSENQNTKKSPSTWLNVGIGWAETKNFETNLLTYKAKQLYENNHMTEFLRLYYLTIRQRAPVFYEQIVNEEQPSWLTFVEKEGG